MKPMILIALCVFVLSVQGCTPTHREYTTRHVETTDTDYGNRGYVGPYATVNRTVVTDENNDGTYEEHVVEHRVDQADEPRGILGSTFHFIGQVIAFPFKLVAGLVDLIF